MDHPLPLHQQSLIISLLPNGPAIMLQELSGVCKHCKHKHKHQHKQMNKVLPGPAEDLH